MNYYTATDQSNFSIFFVYIIIIIINKKGIKAQVTAVWWERFKGRHLEVVLRRAASLSLMRSIASDRDIIEWYFDLLEDTLNQNGIYITNQTVFLTAMKLVYLFVPSH